MTKEKKWRFVSNLNAIDDGLNDAGIETFSADAEKSMIREVNQNSIDQISEYAKKNKLPVIVEFEDFYIQPQQFPNAQQFNEILEKCIKSAEKDKVVKDFFLQAKSIMQKPIRVLRISDYNTTGLIGAESGKKGTPWHSLVKSKGSSNKNMSSGGSFGIGKSAPFACSNLRTVFYASKAKEVLSYIGVSRLISFEDDGDTTIGTGYFSEDEKLQAILEPFGLNKFQRREDGTDIYVMGYDGEANLKEIIKEATLTNFFISIYKGLLTVRYNNMEINRENLGQYIAGLDDKRYIDLKNYYELLCAKPLKENEDLKKIVLDSKEFGQKYGIDDGECTLLLMRGEDLNRRILMTRQPGMSLFLQGNISGTIPFTGILMIEGETMNELFKSMEMPAHDAWEPKRCKVDKEKYEKAYEELRKYLRNKVKECFGQTQDEVIVAYGMEEFFSGTEDSEGKTEATIFERKVKPKIKRNKRQSRKKNRVIVLDDGIDITEKEELHNTLGNEEEKETKKNNEKNNKSKKVKYKYVDVKKRLFCQDEKNGKYVVNFFVEKKKRFVKLEFIGIAEKGYYKLNLLSANAIGGKSENVFFSGNEVIIENITEKNTISLEFQIDFDRKCNMEVNYYEA